MCDRNKSKETRRISGLSMVELLCALSVTAILVVCCSLLTLQAMDQARILQSSNQLRQLAQANLSYAADHAGHFAPAQSMNNLVRWHGARIAAGSPFDPQRGYLAAYLGEDGKVKLCPLLHSYISGNASWEDGTGGYGYNAQYVGGTPDHPYRSAQVSAIMLPAQTVMFTTSAFARSGGIQEYAYAEPFQWVDPNWNLGSPMQPSVHFRARGRAIVAWCDGHISLESPSSFGSDNYYGGNNRKHQVGWFGPSEENGYWNSRR